MKGMESHPTGTEAKAEIDVLAKITEYGHIDKTEFGNANFTHFL